MKGVKGVGRKGHKGGKMVVSKKTLVPEYFFTTTNCTVN